MRRRTERVSGCACRLRPVTARRAGDWEPEPNDPIRRASPALDDVEARRARASVESRLFSSPAEPVTVGRYQVQGRIGSGGMGVVYRAHDPELDRDVAVKLMNPEAGGPESQMARGRLVREARAMARLAHPNVLHVYDVGTVSDGVFIAMELVEGESLDAWLSRAARPWRAVLNRYLDAGRGLSAAHAAGVIHRDFKPENVLVGTDGRVRVGDFGLAGAPAAAENELRDSDEALDERPVAEALTRTGALLGTPKYMAPEQESGAPPNARSDQFSFCVALYEALYGRPPFEGSSVYEYRWHVREGRILPPLPDTGVPASVFEDLARGLSVDPAERHPGMEVLLARLERVLADPRARTTRRRTRFALLGALLALTLGVGWALGRRPSQADESPTRAAPAVAVTDDAPKPRPAQSGSSMRTKMDPETELASMNEVSPDPSQANDPKAATLDDVPSANPPEAALEPSARPSDESSVQSRSRTHRRRSICYFQQDKYKFLGERRRHERYVRGDDGQCYDCSRVATDFHRRTLTPPASADCRVYRICAEESSESCGAS